MLLSSSALVLHHHLVPVFIVIDSKLEPFLASRLAKSTGFYLHQVATESRTLEKDCGLSLP